MDTVSEYSRRHKGKSVKSSPETFSFVKEELNESEEWSSGVVDRLAVEDRQESPSVLLLMP